MKPIRIRPEPFEASYQFTAGASRGNAFAWMTGEPSVFAASRHFAANSNGESQSEVSSRFVRKHEEEKGRSPGTLYGISKASDAAAEEFQHRIKENLKRKRAAGHCKG